MSQYLNTIGSLDLQCSYAAERCKLNGELFRPDAMLLYGLFAQTYLSQFLEFLQYLYYFKPVALKKAKTVYNFGLSECSKVKYSACLSNQCRPKIEDLYFVVEKMKA